MSDVKAHKCIRCGIDVHLRGSACADCMSTDRVYVERLRPSPTTLVEVVRPEDCPTPSRTAQDRHAYRGEPSCRACLDHAEGTRKPRKRATPTAPVVRPDDCPAPSLGTLDRHYDRGEPACRACLNHRNSNRKSRAKVTA